MIKGSCRLCSLVASGGGPSSFDAHWLSNQEFVLTPALGMFVPGYFLVTSRLHRLAIASIGRSFESLYAKSEVLRKPFGDYLVFEHATSSSASGLGPCISHAHAHLVPVSNSCFEFVLQSLADAQPGTWKDAIRLVDQGYVYICFGGRSFIAPAGGEVRGQWLRRKIAEFMSIEFWDWSAYYGHDELGQTIQRLSSVGLDPAGPQAGSPGTRLTLPTAGRAPRAAQAEGNSSPERRWPTSAFHRGDSP
jgi:hypothetical protein